MSQVNVNKKKKRSVPITPQNELPNGHFSVALFTYLEKKIQVKSSTSLGHAIYVFCVNNTFIFNAKTFLFVSILLGNNGDFSVQEMRKYFPLPGTNDKRS
jgi:hypothetical protein